VSVSTLLSNSNSISTPIPTTPISLRDQKIAALRRANEVVEEKYEHGQNQNENGNFNYSNSNIDSNDKIFASSFSPNQIKTQSALIDFDRTQAHEFERDRIQKQIASEIAEEQVRLDSLRAHAQKELYDEQISAKQKQSLETALLNVAEHLSSHLHGALTVKNVSTLDPYLIPLPHTHTPKKWTLIVDILSRPIIDIDSFKAAMTILHTEQSPSTATTQSSETSHSFPNHSSQLFVPSTKLPVWVNSFCTFLSNITEAQRTHFFIYTMPFLQTLVLQLPILFEGPLSALRTGHNNTVHLTSHQCGCLMALAFFSLHIHRDPQKWNAFNFDTTMMFINDQQPTQEHKLRCIFNYFLMLKQQLYVNKSYKQKHDAKQIKIKTKQKFVSMFPSYISRCIYIYNTFLFFFFLYF
jgi:hypothetical protein